LIVETFVVGMGEKKVKKCTLKNTKNKLDKIKIM
jgi:hypothetical protein